MISYFQKFKGIQIEKSPSVPLKSIMLTWFGSFLAIAAVALATNITHEPLVLGSFGASCVLLFGFPKSPFSQPKNVILGHFLSSLIGLIFYHYVGDAWWSLSLALATAISIMIMTQTAHPPAGSNPVIVFLTGANWEFLITPTLIGSIILVIVALFYLNLDKTKQYPSNWF